MKKISQTTVAFLLLLVFISKNSLQAQGSSRSEFEKAIIQEFCDSFSKASPRLSKENMTAEMGLMILPLFTKYSIQIKSEWNLDASNAKDFRGIGEKIGQLGAVQCPAFQEYIKANLKDLTAEESTEGKTFSGKMVRMEGKPFTYLVVQNAQGKMDKFYWMEFFPGADKLGASANAYLNKSLRISYKEMEVYQVVEKEYKTIKVITRVDF